MRFSTAYDSCTYRGKKEARFQKRSVLSYPLLKLPIAQRLALGFLVPALIAFTTLSAVAFQNHQLISEESTLSQYLMRGNNSLDVAFNNLQLMHTYLQGTITDATETGVSAVTIREDLNALKELEVQSASILTYSLQDDGIVHNADQLALFSKTGQRPLAERQYILLLHTAQSWQSYRGIQDQMLQAISTGNLKRAYALEYPQGDLAYSYAMGTLLTFRQFNESLNSSILHVMAIQEHRLQTFTVLALVCVLLGIGIVGWLVSSTLVQRLQQLGHVFQIVEQGRLDARIPVVGKDEIAAVGVAVNSMLNTLEHDITERQGMEQQLRENEERYRTVVTNAPIVLFALDAAGIFTLSEGLGLQRLGLQPGQVTGLSSFDVYADFPLILDQLRHGLAGESVSRVNQIHDMYFDTHVTPLFNQENQLTGLIGIAIDISERVHAQQKIQYQGRHDALTGLHNRVQMLEQVEQAIQETEEGVALLVMDLNHFKDINDTFGHQYGDQVLQEVGKRLSQVMGNAEMVARLGGDEFAILLPTYDVEIIRWHVERLLSALEEQFIIGDYTLHVDASLGAALYPAHGMDALTLLRRADVAMYTAKQAKEGYALYNASADRYSPHRLALLGALRHAIDKDELLLYYQPQSDIRTGRVQGVEALVRWQHPTFGFVTPDQFIPLAEQTGLIVSLTQWVLKTAIYQCKQWLDEGNHLCVSVNLSALNLREVNLPETIAALLKQAGVPPAFLRVEVTESAVMTDVERALDVLTRISELGVSISVDDFGTGYSSLAYLKRLPVDELKIDRSFVQHLSEVQADVAIVRSTILLAHNLGMKVVAEGIEDEAAWHLLETLECDTAQGYYLSRPLSVQNFERWLSNTREAVVI